MLAITIGRAKTALINLMACLGTIGVILGPASWCSSHAFYSDLDTFEANGERAVATIDRVYETVKYRYVLHSVDLHFRDIATGAIVRVDGVEINALYKNELRTNSEVEILYVGEEVILVDDYKPEYVPPIKKPYWGMLLSLFSLGYFTAMVIVVRRKRASAKT